MRLLIRSIVGMALFAGGLTFLFYGIAQAIETGNCGTDQYGNTVGPPCPSGFGEMIVLMILGAFVAFAGSAIFASRDPGAGGFSVLSGMLRFFAAGLLGAGAAVVVAVVDLHADDTRPGDEIVLVTVGAILLVSLPALLRRRPADGPPAPLPVVPAIATTGPPAPKPPASTARAEEIASRLQQLDQLRGSGLLGDEEYAARRKQILGEL